MPAEALLTAVTSVATMLLGEDALKPSPPLLATRILDSTTVELITSLQYQLSPNQWLGLLWTYFNTGVRWVWAHDGASDGVSTVYAFCPEENSAVIVLTNGESFWNGTYVIMNALFDYALQFAVEEQTYTSIVSQHILPTIFHGPLILPDGTKCKVFDITGRTVQPESMKPGIYFIEIDGVMRQKVVKIR